MRNPRDFFKPLAIDAPEPVREIPFKPSRMIHFLDFSNEKMVAKVPDIAPTGRHPARQPRGRRPGRPQGGRARGPGQGRHATSSSATRSCGRASTRSSRPGCSTTSPRSSTEIGDKLDVIMVPKVEGAVGHPLRRPPARPARGQGGHRAPDPRPRDPRDRRRASSNLEEIAAASPRMQGMSFGPADLAASRRMKTTRVGGGHPGYRVIEDPDPDEPGRAARHRPAGPVALLDRAHGRRLHRRRDPARSTARTATSRTSRAARPSSAPRSCSAASAPGRCTRCRSTSPRRSSRPTPTRSAFAKKVIEAIPDGRGVHMIDGKMQDDATWKQCKVMVDLAEMLAAKDPELAEAYGFDPPPRSRERGSSACASSSTSPRRSSRGGDPRHQARLRQNAGGGAADRRGDRRPGRDQVAGADRRAHEGRRREVRRHARRGGRARRGRSSARDQRPHAARRAGRPKRRSSRSTTPASSGTASASSR